MNNRKKYFIKEQINKYGDKEFALTYEGEEYCYITRNTREEAEEKLKELESTFYLSDYDNDEIKEWFDSLGLTLHTLYHAIDKCIGLKLDYEAKLKMDKYNQYKYVEIASDVDLANIYPILSCAWKKFRIETFNGGISVYEKTGELFLWGDIHFMYEDWHCGSNGTEILRFSYSKSEGWNIKVAKQEYIENHTYKED